MLQETVGPHLPATQKEMQILNLACGRCDEAETLVSLGREITHGGDVRMVGADIRIREIRQARETHSKLPAEFLIQDAAQLQQHKELGDDFDLVFLRHQNFWHGQEIWKKIFDQGRARLGKNGLLVITSYFDHEHKLALAVSPNTRQTRPNSPPQDTTDGRAASPGADGDERESDDVVAGALNRTLAARKGLGRQQGSRDQGLGRHRRCRRQVRPDLHSRPG